MPHAEDSNLCGETHRRARPDPSRTQSGASTNTGEHVPADPEHPHLPLGRPAIAGLTRAHPRAAAPPENPLQPGP